MSVPRDIVDAAGPECRRLPYTQTYDCKGYLRSDGTVAVASGAGRYHPAFYLVVGTAALPFDGFAALYAMRVTATLCCWAALMGALLALRTWAQTLWPYVGFILACSPMVIFSSAVVAPNGLEMCAAAGLWAALLGLLRHDLPDRDRNTVLLVGTASAMVLVTARSLGPMWASLIVTTVVLSTDQSWSRVRQLAHQRAVLPCAGLVVAATIGSLAWTLTNRTLVVGKLNVPDSLSEHGDLIMYTRAVLVWIYQSVGAFPNRDEAAPMVAYASYFLVVSAFVIRGLATAHHIEKIAITGVMVCSLALPLAITMKTIDVHGLAWNGGYTIAFSMGFLMLCGATLDRARASFAWPVALLAAAFYAVAHVVSPLAIRVSEELTSPGAQSGAWVMLPPALLAAPAVVAAVVPWWAMGRAPASQAPHEDELHQVKTS